jgi:hypothetical protein
MNKGTTLLASLALAGAFATSATLARAEKEEPPKNLKVLSKDLGKDLGNGMKAFSKGLGVECKACHVKGKLDLDDVAAKDISRKFLADVVGEKDAAKRAEALKPVLESLKLAKAKDEKKLWEGIDLFKKAQ